MEKVNEGRLIFAVRDDGRHLQMADHARASWALGPYRDARVVRRFMSLSRYRARSAGDSSSVPFPPHMGRPSPPTHPSDSGWPFNTSSRPDPCPETTLSLPQPFHQV